MWISKIAEKDDNVGFRKKEASIMIVRNCLACVMSILVLLLVGCENFLEENPESVIAPNNFYQTASDAKGAVNDVYNILNPLYNIWIIRIADTPSDEGTMGYNSNNINDINMDQGNYTPDIQWLELWWADNYDGINRSNMAIANIPEVDMDTDLRTRLVGEAKFLRALFYFNLVRAYGDVPLITEPTEDISNVEKPRTPKEAVYDQIVADLQDAEQVLPESYSGSDVGRATSGAAKSLLAKVHLTIENWQEAASKANEVINSGTYALFPDYADLWKKENENTVEYIFSVQYKSDVMGSWHSSLRAPRLLPVARGVTFGENVPEQEYYDSFRDDDYRKEVNYRTEMPNYNNPDDTVTFPPHDFKLFEREAPTVNGGKNYPILRYADVLLMHAEALNEANGGPTPEAYDAINQVRNRAQIPSLSGLSQEAFRDSVIQERSWELGLEGHRWFDLVRTGKLIPVLAGERGLPVEEHNLVYPIPQRELDTNPELTQNPGY